MLQNNKNTLFKNIKLFIAPLLIVVSILIFESANSFIEQNKTFEQKATQTTSVLETDVSMFEKATVKSVIDGDTIELQDGRRVRYLLVDTPETVHPQKKVQCFGKEASKKNKELLNGQEIYLEKDISETDRYNRLLRYVYLPNPKNPNEVIMINELLIEQGFAQVVTYPPDIKYKDRFLAVQRKAQDEKRGLWGNCSN